MGIDYAPKPRKDEYKAFHRGHVKPKVLVTPVVDTSMNHRVTEKHRSRVTKGGSTALKEPLMYSGDKMLGVTILHKSNLVPVFSQQEAMDAANMRR